MQISVVVPLYNKKEGILKALNSVFQQTFQSSEIIVINDGSTDGSEKLVEELNSPLIRLIHQANAGVSAARNRGVEEAQGDWIAFLDADDMWKPDFLDTIVLLHQNYPEAKVLATTYQLQDYNGKVSDIILNKIPFENRFGLLSNYFEVAACSDPPICSSAVVVAKIAFEKVDGFPTGIKSGEDLLTWAKLATICEIAYCSESKSYYCFPINIDSSFSFRLPDKIDYVGSELKKLLSLESTKNKVFLRKYISNWHKMRLHLFAHHALKTQSFKEFILSLKYNPFNYKVYLILVFAFLPNNMKNIILRNSHIFK